MMVRTSLLLAVLLVLHCVVQAQELNPYPKSRITEAQWREYFEEVKAKHGASEQLYFRQRLVVFVDKQTRTSYTFTQLEHPAHPAWVTRRLLRDGERYRVVQVGFYAGNRNAFRALFKTVQHSTERTIKERQSDQKQPP